MTSMNTMTTMSSAQMLLITEIEDLLSPCPFQEGGKSCSSTPSPSLEKENNLNRMVKEALESPDTYKAIDDLNNLSNKKCLAIKSDHYSTQADCMLANAVDKMARALLSSNFLKNVTFDRSACLFMSPFLKKETKTEGQSDLTGDGGQLALRMLKEHDSLNFDVVVDIGGQDTDSVSHFPEAKKFIVDINIVTPFLHKGKDVSYLIGDAKTMLQNPDSLPTERKKTLFMMSNFINVLTPQEGWEMLTITAKRMQPNDALVITNLATEQFAGRKGYQPFQNSQSLKGMTTFSHEKSAEKPYKTTIDDRFGEHLMNDEDMQGLNLNVEDTALEELQCQVGAIGVPVKFRTLFITKSDEEGQPSLKRRKTEASSSSSSSSSNS
jgi:hypothetical protein